MAKYAEGVDRNSAAYRLFHERYYVIMSPMQVRSIEDIRTRGVVSSGEKAYDDAMRAERRVYYMTGADLVTLFSRGVQIRMQYPKDSVKLYETMQEHLADFAHAIGTRHHVRVDQDVLDDLQAIEEFAAVVYPMAYLYSDKAASMDSFTQRFLGVGSKGSGGLLLKRHVLTNQSTEKTNETEELPAPPPRQSYEGVFRRRKIEHDPVFNQRGLLDRY